MLASSVAAPAVTRFGKKAQGVSARKAISRVPVGGHKVQVRLLSTSSPDFHPLLDATAAGACAAPFVPPAPGGRSRVVLTPSSSPHRVPGGSTRPRRRAARTPRVARTPSPYRYLDTSYPISCSERTGSRARIMRLKPTRAPTTTTQTDHLILVTNHRPRRRLRSPCPPRAPRRPPT